MIRLIRRFACAAVLAAAPLGAAQACDYSDCNYSACECPAPVCCRYVPVTCYVDRCVTRTCWVTVEDECGCCHRVPRYYTVHVQVPVTRLVQVCE
jgi:hypothetical protein